MVGMSSPEEYCIYYIQLSRRWSYCIQTRRQCYYISLNRETGLANLSRSSLSRRAICGPHKHVGVWGSRGGYFYTNGQHSHLDQRSALPSLWASQVEWGRWLCQFPIGLRFWYWYGHALVKKHTFTQDFTCSGLPPIPIPQCIRCSHLSTGRFRRNDSFFHEVRISVVFQRSDVATVSEQCVWFLIALLTWQPT